MLNLVTVCFNDINDQDHIIYASPHLNMFVCVEESRILSLLVIISIERKGFFKLK